MNIIFFGNGKFAQTSLEKLHSNEKHNLLLVVTNNTKKKGRGLTASNTAIANYCNANDINLFTTNNIKDLNNIRLLANYNADIFVVIEYKILPEAIYTIPKHGTINIHGSLLPKYRGAAPIQRAIMNNERTFGVTSFKLNCNIDGGDIIESKSNSYDDKKTYGDIYKSLASLGSDLLIESLDFIDNHKPFLIQDTENVTLAPKINKKEYKIDFNHESLIVHNNVRALTPPSPFAFINNKKIKLYDTYYSNDSYNLDVGEHVYDNGSIYIGCKSGVLIVNSFQFESKKKITALDFSNMTHLKASKFK